MIWLLLGAALLAAGSFGSYYAMAKWSMLQRLLVAVLQRGLQRMAAAADGDHKHYSIHRTATGQFNCAAQVYAGMIAAPAGASPISSPQRHTASQLGMACLWSWCTGLPPDSISQYTQSWLPNLPCSRPTAVSSPCRCKASPSCFKARLAAGLYQVQSCAATASPPVSCCRLKLHVILT